MVDLIPRAELWRRVARGEVDHAIVMAGLLWYRLKSESEG